ncbi:MAG: four-helix bundle copper-binding protein [Bacillota bacterium]
MNMQNNIVNTIQHCEAVCEHMTTLVHCLPNLHLRVAQMRLLRDCADICSLTAKYIARGSSFARHAAHLCAMICEACANECLRFPDQHSQHCAQVCLHCAQQCRAFAAMMPMGEMMMPMGEMPPMGEMMMPMNQ